MNQGYFAICDPPSRDGTRRIPDPRHPHAVVVRNAANRSGVMASLLREEDREELRHIFDAFDHNSDGLLDVDEVAAILHSFGTPMTEAEVRQSPQIPVPRAGAHRVDGARGGRCLTW